jgi:hypothetical protein
MDNKRGQAAIEFLVTYGWAIMAAMLVIGALTYFGITNPSTVLPDKCVFSNGFECQDYSITANKMQLRLINGFGDTIYNPGVAPTDGVGSCVIASPGMEWAPDDTREINCTSVTDMPFNPKDKAKVKISVSYSKTPTGYNQVSLGEIYATVQ